MKIGLFSICPDIDVDPAIVAKHAEDGGFHSYWVADHPTFPVQYETAYPGRPADGTDPDYLWKMPEPLIALMRAATATESIQLGTAILLIAERHPLHLAKEIASLDAFSNGRFHFGIGAGWCREEAEILGVDFDHRWGQARECVEIIKSCWTDDATEYHGKYYDFPAVKCYPKPSSLPHPPIYLPSIMVGGEWSERVFNRIVKWGDGWLPVVMNVQQVVDGMSKMKEIASAAGKSDKKINVNVLGALGQWRTRKGIDGFVAAGVDQVTIWMESTDLDSARFELDALAEELIV